MPRYEIAIAGNTTATANAVRAELRGATSGERTRVYEIGFDNGVATAGTILMGFANAIGVTPTSPQTVITLAAGDTSTAQTAIAWGTAPTLPTNPLRRFSYAAAIGSATVWTWSQDEPIRIPLSGSLIFWNLAASSSATIGFYFSVS